MEKKLTPLSIIIPVFNEELLLPRVLENISSLGVDIFILDSCSTDRSVEIAKEYGCHITTGQWGSFSEKLNFGLNRLPIKTEWVMRLDADEYLTDEFVSEISRVLSSTDSTVDGIIVRRRIMFLGKWIKHGGIYPLMTMRITRAGKAQYESRLLDEHVHVKGKSIYIDLDIVDDDQKGLAAWLRKHVGYAETQCMMDYRVDEVNTSTWRNLSGSLKWRRFLKEEVYQRTPLFFRPFCFWVYRYIFLGGFLDGKPGFIYHFLHVIWYRFSIDALLYEAKITKGASVKKKHTC